QFRVESGEQCSTRNRRRFQTGQLKALGTYVDDVSWVRLSPEVRMVERPGCIGRPVRDGDSFCSLEPAKDYMHGAGATNVAPTINGPLDLTKQSEEQKNISGADALVFKVALGITLLPEQRSPAVRSRNALKREVRVKVSTVRG